MRKGLYIPDDGGACELFYDGVGDRAWLEFKFRDDTQLSIGPQKGFGIPRRGFFKSRREGCFPWKTRDTPLQESNRYPRAVDYPHQARFEPLEKGGSCD